VREARLAGEFHHPNMVQVYDLGESDGSFYMVMEWLEGESLATRLERVGRLTFAEMSESLVPCMHAIQRAHDAGIIHRDIKPANIFLCDATADRPALSKVLDFGISKRVTASTDMSTFVTKTGMLIGTPHYLAPEQLRARPVDRRTDIYGFGVLLYQTLAGVLPFAADNFGDLVVEISVGTPRSLRELVPDLPVGVEQVVARAMAREPEQRYPSLHELIASLQAIDPTPLTAATLPQINVPSSLRPISTVVSDSAIRSGSRDRMLVAVATAVSLVAAAVGFVVLQRDQSASDASSAIVRPRELPSIAAASDTPDTLQQSASQLPAHDAAVDGGAEAAPENVAGRPAEAKSAAPKAAEPQIAKPKPAAQAPAPPKPAAPDELTQPPKPTQPTAAPPTVQPVEVREPEHNPLHMNIQ
jgi:serine/threonine-protein kinase